MPLDVSGPLAQRPEAPGNLRWLMRAQKRETLLTFMAPHSIALVRMTHPFSSVLCAPDHCPVLCAPRVNCRNTITRLLAL